MTDTIEQTDQPVAEAKPLPALTGKQWQAITKFCGDDSRPVLASLNIEPDKVVAADGFRLVLVHAATVIDDIGNDEHQDAKPQFPRKFMIHAKVFAKRFGTLISKAQRISFVVFDGETSIRTHGKHEWQVEDFRARPDRVIGEFPDYDQIIGETEIGDGPTVTLNAYFLKEACELAISLQSETRKRAWEGPHIVINPPKGENQAYRLDIPSDHGSPAAEVIIMPMVIKQ